MRFSSHLRLKYANQRKIAANHPLLPCQRRHLAAPAYPLPTNSSESKPLHQSSTTVGSLKLVPSWTSLSKCIGPTSRLLPARRSTGPHSPFFLLSLRHHRSNRSSQKPSRCHQISASQIRHPDRPRLPDPPHLGPKLLAPNAPPSPSASALLRLIEGILQQPHICRAHRPKDYLQITLLEAHGARLQASDAPPAHVDHHDELDPRVGLEPVRGEAFVDGVQQAVVAREVGSRGGVLGAQVKDIEGGREEERELEGRANWGESVGERVVGREYGDVEGVVLGRMSALPGREVGRGRKTTNISAYHTQTGYRRDRGRHVCLVSSFRRLARGVVELMFGCSHGNFHAFRRSYFKGADRGPSLLVNLHR